MLTARGEELDRVIGLELGADDYVVKPFSGAELIARIRAVMRRTDETTAPQAESDDEVEIGEIVLETSMRRVLLAGDRARPDAQGVRAARPADAQRRHGA